jgi:hypothetical protein
MCFFDDNYSYPWGIGSIFLLNYKGVVFGVTAKHVIENQGADCRNIRVSMLETTVTLKIKSAFTPNFYVHENNDEIEDLLFFEVDSKLFEKESETNLYSWDFVTQTYPASKLKIGAELLVTGFPFTDEKYDYDNNIINDLLLIRTANLTAPTFGKDIYTMEATPSDTEFNGLSGSPVFCRIERDVFFCGIVIKGSSSSGLLHFIGSDIIHSALKFKFK